MRPPVPLIAGFGVFVLVLGYLIASSLTRDQVPTFLPRSQTSGALASERPGPDTLTVDANDSNRWRYVDLDSGRVMAPDGDSTGWDLAIQRYHVRAMGAVADAGRTPFDSLALRARSGSLPATGGRNGGGEVIGRWYSYNMLSHLLVPNGHVYLVGTSAGRVAELQPISYYCPGLKAGCLTFRYGFVE